VSTCVHNQYIYKILSVCMLLNARWCEPLSQHVGVRLIYIYIHIYIYIYYVARRKAEESVKRRDEIWRTRVAEGPSGLPSSLGGWFCITCRDGLGQSRQRLLYSYWGDEANEWKEARERNHICK